ncbi:hypothetical protein [Schlesneria sp. T3-172]|uniref:hypothetical protein n=1 Tax=Schlesneria sphaerica TaxID=3373610 RepID=UPI0037CB90C4
MNCAEVESLLDLLAHPDHGGHDFSQGELHKHLATCPACRHAFESIEQWDAQIRPAMNQVEIPTGFAQRLTSVLQDHSPEPTVAKPTPAAIRRWFSPLRTFTVVCTLCIFAAAFWWGQQQRPNPILTPANITSLWEQLDRQSLSPSNTEARLPRSWSSLTQIIDHPWQQVHLASSRLTIPAKRLEIRAKRGTSEEGWLMVVPKSSWGVTPVAPISAARIQYIPRRVWMAWNEGDNVFVLAVDGSPQSLEQIQRQLELNNTVL